MIQPDEAIAAMGSRSISATLKTYNHDCTILFLPRGIREYETPTELQKIVEFAGDYEPDLIGFGFQSGHLNRVLRIVTALKKSLFAPIIFGGVHATCSPDHAIQFADAICVGEGEQVMVELADAFDQGRGFQEVPGIWYREGKTVVRQAPPKRICDLDQLPFPDFDNHYVLRDQQILPLTPELMFEYKYYCNGVHFMMASRGCPGTCAFCCNKTLRDAASGKWLRRRSVDSLLSECRYMLEKYPEIEGFAFWDDSLLTCSSSWLETFCDRYSHEIGLPFLCNLSPEEVTVERIRMLTDAGLSGIQMGLQTGSDRINSEIFKRRSKAATFVHADTILNKFKDKLIDRYYHLISDNPWEDELDIEASVNILNRLKKPYYLSVFSLMFYPGTPLAQRKSTDFPAWLDEVYEKDFFDAQKSFKNRLLRSIPVMPSFLVSFFWNWRRFGIVRFFFQLYYGVVFVPFYRKLTIRKYYREASKIISGKPNRFWPALRYRPR